MENREYFEYMDEEKEDDKIRIKIGKMGNEYFEEDEQIKSEYFEGNLKTEIQETAQRSVNISCDICQKIFKTKDNLRNHYQSVHKSIKFRFEREILVDITCWGPLLYLLLHANLSFDEAVRVAWLENETWRREEGRGLEIEPNQSLHHIRQDKTN